MHDVCWIHNQKFRIGDQCSDCLKREKEYKQSLAVYDEPVESIKKTEPGDRLWGVVKLLVIINLAIFALIVIGSIILR